VAEKGVVWVGTSLRDLRAFPENARRIAGHELRRLQEGLVPADWRPMQSIGLGVSELRIHTEREHRVIYVARFPESIYVLHAFEKRSRKTTVGDLELARRRYGDVLTSRGFGKER
jgi:phage-related protein